MMRPFNAIFAASILALIVAGPVTAFAQSPASKQVLEARSRAAAAYGSGKYELAARLYETLAEEGDASAAWFLGWMYYEGKGVLQDGATALKWFRLAAERGDDMALVNIGMIYNEGRGVPQDYDEAEKWFRRAADQGDVGAQYYLGLMYYEGHGVEQNYVLAHMWLNLAASRVIPKDDEFLQKRDMVASKMSRAQIAEAQRLAREWKPKQ